MQTEGNKKRCMVTLFKLCGQDTIVRVMSIANKAAQPAAAAPSNPQQHQQLIQKLIHGECDFACHTIN